MKKRALLTILGREGGGGIVSQVSQGAGKGEGTLRLGHKGECRRHQYGEGGKWGLGSSYGGIGGGGGGNSTRFKITSTNKKKKEKGPGLVTRGGGRAWHGKREKERRSYAVYKKKKKVPNSPH